MKLKDSKILVIDDDNDVLTALHLLLKKEVKLVVTEKNPEQILFHLTKEKIDLVLLDMNFNASINTGNEGIYWLKRIKEKHKDIPVIMITAYGDIDIAIRSLKDGANDFIVKPWNNQKMLDSIKEVLCKNDLPGKAEINKADTSLKLIGVSDIWKDIIRSVEKIAPTDANVLILGENGTGKDLIATLIHERSLRRDMPLVKVDVGALTESLFESELFGHKKGAFTDAKEERTGRIEEANKGTLFLDEIGNISLHQQAKLLTVLQNRQITKIGTNSPKDIDIRLICATNVPIKELANESKFRKDLIYRINTVEIVLPPLRDRKEDILPLIHHFTDVYCKKYFKSKVDWSSKAIKKIEGYNFPGNVRELQYIIERAIIMVEKDVLDENDIVFSPIESVISQSNLVSESKLSAIEKQTILRVIEKNNGNITNAAKELGITRTALYRRLSKYEIE